MDASLQLKKKQRFIKLDKIQCISFQTVTSQSRFKKKKEELQMEGGLTLVGHNKGELLNHGREQLHLGLYVFSAGGREKKKEITEGQVFVVALLAYKQHCYKKKSAKAHFNNG